MLNQVDDPQNKPIENGEATAEGPTSRFGLSTPGLCLGFANTLEDRLTGHPHETLNSYGDLLAWGCRRGILTGREAAHLTQEASRRAAEAGSMLERSIALREVVYRIFSAVAASRSPPPADLVILNTALAGALATLRVVAMGDRFTWVWVRGEEALDRVVWPVALSAADLLTSNERRAVRECAAMNCGWLFLDTTRNRSRRWCDMKVCGNRAKARRHYERKKASSTPADQSNRR
jgi:predicted RNA-binding Zn ribbon-like protein